MVKSKIISDTITNCQLCDLCKTRSNIVVGRGSISPKIFVVGEAPGENEDKTGMPFVGKSGKRLEACLSEAGFDLSEIFITNVVKCRPPKNRNPTEKEIKACTPHLLNQISELKPAAFLTTGRFASNYILGKDIASPMRDIVGKRFITKMNTDLEYHVFPVYHPAYTLYNPSALQEFKKQLNDAKEFLCQIKLL